MRRAQHPAGAPRQRLHPAATPLLLSVLVLSVLVLGLAQCSAERPAPKVPGASREERLARFHESARTIAEELGALGFPVKISEVTLALGERKQDIRTFVQAAWSGSHGSYEALATLMRAFGIAKTATPYDMRVSAVLAELASAEAYYDPIGQAVVLRGSSFDEASDMDLVVAHELGHVYQDQAQGGLEAFLAMNARSIDRSRSAQAVAEGEAMLMAHAVLLKRRGRGLADLDLSLEEESTEQLLTGEGAGAAYAAGQRFLLAQFRAGGWPAVNGAYRDPPSSTEQLLHPEKYRVDTPYIVTLPAWPNAEDKVQLLSSEVLGELVTKSALAVALTSDEDTSLEGRNRAEVGSIGWDGDRFDSYELEAGQRAALWRSVWDTEPAAREFADALRRFVTKKKLESQYYSVSQQDLVVDFAFSEDATLVPALARALRLHPRHFRALPEDAASTAAAKTAAAVRHARQPRLEGKYWVHPVSAVRVPVPEGWKLRIRGGLPLLLGPEREEAATPVITAFRRQDLWDGDLRAFLHKMENVYYANPARFGQVESAVRRTAGSDVGVITLRVGNKSTGMMLRLWVIPRPGHYLLLVAGFPEDLWQESGPLLAALERGLVIEPAEL